MQLHLVWKPWGIPGVEHLSLATGEDFVNASSYLLQHLNGESIAASYVLSYDRHWRFRRLWLQVDSQGRRSLELRHNLRGQWLLDGELREDLTGCQQVMFSASPFLHTAPLVRSALDSGESEHLAVAHIDLLSLRVEARQQRYRCLQRLHDHAIYQCAAEGHKSCELTVDADGLVVQAIGQFVRDSRKQLSVG